MTFNCEDALMLKSMEMAHQCCEDDKSLNQPMVRMTLPPSKKLKRGSVPNLGTTTEDPILTMLAATLVTS